MTGMRAWSFGLGLATAEWLAALGLARFMWEMIGAGIGFPLGAAICAALLLLWSAIGGAVLLWAVRCR